MKKLWNSFNPLKIFRKRKPEGFQQNIKASFKEDFHSLDLKFEQLNTKIDLRIEQLSTKIESTNGNTLKWFMGGFVTITLMILGLFATILLK